MAITNYDTLLSAVANWTARGDLTSRIPEGIALTEAKLNRELRTVDQETKQATFTISVEYVAVPTDFLQVKTFYLNTPRQPLTQEKDDVITAVYGSTTGTPERYSVLGSNFRFGPVPSVGVVATLVYAAKVPALTSTASTNWVISSHPDLYLYGVNAEMWAFAHNPEKAKMWMDLFMLGVDRLKAQSDRKANRDPDKDSSSGAPPRQ